MESLILNLFVCLIIPLAMSLLVLSGKSRQLFISLLVGIFMCMFASQVNGFIATMSGYDSYTLTTAITPIVEEIMKTIPIVVLAFVIGTDRQTLLECALMVGLGFATMENVYMLMINAYKVSLNWAIFRGLGAAMLHATSSLVIAYGLSYCKVRRKIFITGTYAMLLGVMVFHGIFNMLVQSEKYMYLGLILPMIVFVTLSIRILKDGNSKNV